jgi:hypothetical protein
MQRSESESDFMFLVENKVIDELKNQLRIKIVDNCYKILKKRNIINWDNFFLSARVCSQSLLEFRNVSTSESFSLGLEHIKDVEKIFNELFLTFFLKKR